MFFPHTQTHNRTTTRNPPRLTKANLWPQKYIGFVQIYTFLPSSSNRNTNACNNTAESPHAPLLPLPLWVDLFPPPTHDRPLPPFATCHAFPSSDVPLYITKMLNYSARFITCKKWKKKNYVNAKCVKIFPCFTGSRWS